MQKEKQLVRPSPCGKPHRAARLCGRLPTIVKIILTLPLVLALLGAEIELRLAPQLDVVLTAAGVCTIWAWLAGRPSTMM